MTVPRTRAYRLLGWTRHEAGWLELARGRLVWTADNGTGWDAPLAEVADVRVPWYYALGGIRMSVRREPYRFSFVQPNNDVLRDGPGIGEGRRALRLWREALGA